MLSSKRTRSNTSSDTTRCSVTHCASLQIFSYHLIEAPGFSVVARLLSSAALRRVTGLRHAECLLPMRMGHAVVLPGRYHFSTLALFAFWDSEAHLDRFLEAPPYRVFARAGWHVRLRFYRRWGTYAGLDEAKPYTELANPEGPVVAVTVARLKLIETLRFARWGKPVEAQVRDHPGVTRAAVGFRPLNTFSTFSTWRSEEDMLSMVRGREAERDGTGHRDAMRERARRDFHYEFTTMRFVPLSEHGQWPEPVRLLPASTAARAET